MFIRKFRAVVNKKLSWPPENAIPKKKKNSRLKWQKVAWDEEVFVLGLDYLGRFISTTFLCYINWFLSCYFHSHIDYINVLTFWFSSSCQWNRNMQEKMASSWLIMFQRVCFSFFSMPAYIRNDFFELPEACANTFAYMNSCQPKTLCLENLSFCERFMEQRKLINFFFLFQPFFFFHFTRM